MADLKLSIDVSDAIKATQTLRKVESNIRQLSARVASGSITQDTYNKGLRQQNAILRQTGVSVSKATTMIHSYAKSVLEAKSAQDKAADMSQWFAAQRRRMQMMKESERIAAQQAREEERVKTNYERLRATLDSNYAARMRLRQASQTLRAAVDAEIISVQEAAAMLRQYNAAANSSSVATTDLAGRMNRAGVITQQAGYQMGDFIVQVQSGTNWMVAFGQQATQVAGTLTLLGGKWILIGSVLGVAIPLITAAGAAFMRTRNQAEEATESYEGLAQTLTKLEQIRLNSVGESLADGAKEAIKEWENLLALLERVELRDLESALKKEFDNIIDQLSAFQNRLDVAARLGITAPEFTLFDLDNMEEGIRLAQIVRDIQGDSRQELQEQLRIAEERLRNEGLLTDATEELLSNLADALGLTESLSDKTNEAADAAERFANNLVLGQEYLANAVRAGVASGAIPPQALNSLPQTAGEKAYQDLMERRRKEYYANQDKESRGRRGGGKDQDPLKQLREQLRLEEELLGKSEAQQRVIRALGVDWRRYGEQTVNSLISSIEQMNEFNKQVEQQQELANTIETSMSDAFMSMVDGTKTASDAFKDMARSIIKQLYDVLVVQRLVGSFNASTGTGTGLVGAIMGAIPGNASGGYMSAGKPYIVGEHGPELVIPGRSGTVMNADLTNKAMGGGNPAPIVNLTYNFQGGVTEADLSRALPVLVERTKREVVDAVQRGGSVARVFR